VQRVGSATLAAGEHGLSRPLPLNWMIRLQARFPAKQSTLRLELGSSTVMVFDGSHIWHRVEVTKRGVEVDGRRTGAPKLTASSVTLRAQHGPVEIRGLVISQTKP
jgi:hypothetical protein